MEQYPTRLILWDVDHTLISTCGAGAGFARTAFEQATGIPLTHNVDVTGQTETAIIDALIEAHGLAPSTVYRDRHASALAEQYETHRDRLASRGQALPGAQTALAAIAERGDTIQTVLTGNYHRVAVVKLDVFELASYIDFESGAYGEDHIDRARLVPAAQQRATAKYGHPFTAANTVIIGDSLYDVAAANQGGAAIIAIATGRDTSDDLYAAGATIVLPNLADTAAVVNAIDNATKQP